MKEGQVGGWRRGEIGEKGLKRGGRFRRALSGVVRGYYGVVPVSILRYSERGSPADWCALKYHQNTVGQVYTRQRRRIARKTALIYRLLALSANSVWSFATVVLYCCLVGLFDRMKSTRVARAVRMTLDAAEARLRVINAVGARPHWTVRLDGGTSELQAKYQLRNFSRTWEFLNEVALVAHKMQHHPTITTTYNRVDIVLTTHDEANNVTERDTELAAEIERIFRGYESAGLNSLSGVGSI